MRMPEDEKRKEKKFIGGYGWNAKDFGKAIILARNILDIIMLGVMRGKRFRVEIVCDPEKENTFRMIAAEFAEGDTDEEFHKFYEF